MADSGDLHRVILRWGKRNKKVRSRAAAAAVDTDETDVDDVDGTDADGTFLRHVYDHDAKTGR